tara:strand:+ start:659 stop:808 length:150 start_codon:yes stop_codon:yes gene_type:complete
MERMYTVPGTTPEEYLQRTSLRPMLASLLERTCKDKPVHRPARSASPVL